VIADEYDLLKAFRSLFEGNQYLHRDSSLGDWVASYLYEDLFKLRKSGKLNKRITAGVRVLNTQNRTVGIARRRGDGTFGELVPAGTAIREEGLAVARGPVATIEIGVETKILAKAMIKQIDRVMTSLRDQVAQFRLGGGNPICVAVVGINHAESVIGYEGDRPFPTTGRGGFLHPIQEAAEAERRLREQALPAFDEFLILRYRATNAAPFPFEWVDYSSTRLDYAAVLSRISSRYQQRF